MSAVQGDWPSGQSGVNTERLICGALSAISAMTGIKITAIRTIDRNPTSLTPRTFNHAQPQITANQMGALADNMVLGAIIAGLIHCLNLLLSVLSPSIQSMRLQYVEFFSKFYEGGGRLYRPFKKR